MVMKYTANHKYRPNLQDGDVECPIKLEQGILELYGKYKTGSIHKGPMKRVFGSNYEIFSRKVNRLIRGSSVSLEDRDKLKLSDGRRIKSLSLEICLEEGIERAKKQRKEYEKLYRIRPEVERMRF